MKHIQLALLITLIVALSRAAFATDGYFPVGYGTIEQGMGGAGTATTEDTYGGANNPAAMVWVGNRLDIGIEWFSPNRGAARDGASFPSINGSIDSGRNYFFDDTNNFFIPAIGFNHMFTPRLAAGITVYGNGGMDTSYPQTSFNFGRGPANFLGGSGKLGIDMMQMIIAPTLSWNFMPHQSIGISPQIALQRFKADGLDGFSMLSSDPANLTNRGYDSSMGIGLRVGYLAKLSKAFSFGATYCTPITMGRLNKYRGLFAQHGRFDIPENYDLGISVRPVEPLQIALDYQHISYGQVKAVANPSTVLLQGAMLGDDNGPGFGWRDVDVFKLGLEYRLSSRWTVRGGFAHCNNPITPRDVTFNILAPGVIQDHLTVGATWQLDKTSSLSGAFIHAFDNSVSGPSLFNRFGMVSGAGETIHMDQNSFSLSWSKNW